MTHENKSLQPRERRLKITRKYVPRAWYQYVVMPEIRLCGKWLLDLGFECGEEVTVKYFENKLEITLNPTIEVEPVAQQKRRVARRKESLFLDDVK
ncbi:hypothetical protein [Dyadobacter sp. CY326]|uniref:hypothetical protein n=1 Tax=Dyadobacter sp. CY326 TaxID=2907300 RepID=UPI001F3ACE4C|nr:hypothetical protein [Dyadobacter sp. CY326]MCE7064540.1 hypothetical protein [Dyadobacter sp. CY326]